MFVIFSVDVDFPSIVSFLRSSLPRLKVPGKCQIAPEEEFDSHVIVTVSPSKMSSGEMEMFVPPARQKEKFSKPTKRKLYFLLHIQSASTIHFTASLAAVLNAPRKALEN